MKICSNSSALTVTDQGEVSYCLNGVHEWQGTGQILILHYYDRQHPRAQQVVVPISSSYSFGTAGTPSLSATAKVSIEGQSETSMRLHVEFSSIAIRVSLTIFVLEQGFSIRIEDKDIAEGNPQLYRVLGLEILPGFGGAKTGESGYLTLPNWSGCQTFFDKNYPREVRQTIYSSNDQWEHACNMAVFGITRSQGTLCGVVAGGDYDAQLVCRVHWEEQQTNSTHLYWVYRWQQEDDLILGARELRYHFAPPQGESGEGYAFCAKTYRAFLSAERGLQTWEQKAITRPAVLDFKNRFFLKIFMAYKDPQADGKGTYHVTCNFENTRAILEDCLKQGIDRLAVILVGWGQDGHDGMPPTRFPVDERLGGETEFKKLLSWCQENNILLAVHDSYGAYYSCSPEFNTEDLIRHRSGEYWESIIWSGGQAHIACPSIWVDKHVKRDIPAVRALGVYGHHHIDAVGSFVTCYSKDHPLESRAEFAGQVRRMFQVAIEQMGSVSTEMPFGPYFDVVDGFYHTYSSPSSWHRHSPVGRFFLDRSVPLIPIVMHGSANCYESVGQHAKDPLFWLARGLMPQWEVCWNSAEAFGISSYSKASETLLKIWKIYFGSGGLIDRLNDATIEGRWELSEFVSKTIYSNGLEVTVNAGKETFQALQPGEYQIIEHESAQKSQTKSI